MELREFQKNLQKWNSEERSALGITDIYGLLAYFLQNHQAEDILDILWFLQKELPLSYNEKVFFASLTDVVLNRSKSNRMLLPVFIIAAPRSGSTYMRNALQTSYGYRELRAFTLYDDKIPGPDGFHNISSNLFSLLLGKTGMISRAHVFPDESNRKKALDLLGTTFLVFLFRHPIAAIFSRFYRLAYNPRPGDKTTYTHLDESGKQRFLSSSLEQNLASYTSFYSNWLDFILQHQAGVKVICYENFEDDFDHAVVEAVNFIGLDPKRLTFPEKNQENNYQRHLRPDYREIVGQRFFESYEKAIQCFDKLKTL